MKTPYDQLGVKPTATLAEIQAAYRRLAMKHHPDREGGDIVTMQLVQTAYDILSDAELRKQFDEKGTTVRGESLRMQVEKAIPTIVLHLLQQTFRPTCLRQGVIEHAEQKLAEARIAQPHIVKQRDKLSRELKRFKRKNGENFIAAALKEQIEMLCHQLAANTEEQLGWLEMIEVMEDYSYNVFDTVEELEDFTK